MSSRVPSRSGLGKLLPGRRRLRRLPLRGWEDRPSGLLGPKVHTAWERSQAKVSLFRSCQQRFPRCETFRRVSRPLRMRWRLEQAPSDWEANGKFVRESPYMTWNRGMWDDWGARDLRAG